MEPNMQSDKPGMFRTGFEAMAHISLFILACLAVIGLAGLAVSLLFELISNVLTGSI